MTIATAINRIKNDELVLPALQRRFVWAPERMYSYFDSLMRGYPTGVLLFWNTTQRVQYRKFIQTDTPDLKLTYHIKEAGKRGTMVLDGQQRLQSLYIALEGGLDGKKLYFDVLGSGFDYSDTSHAKYQFEFLSDREARERNERNYATSLWIPFSQIFQCKDVAQRHFMVNDLINNAKINSISPEAARLGVNIEIAYSKLKAETLLNHYTIDLNYGEDGFVTPIEEILEIFVRINSGGQVLSRSDLMFSLMQLNWEEAGENIDELLDAINERGNFDFDRDFVLRCALVCCGKGARFDVAKLRDVETIRKIEAIFPRVAHALENFVDFLVSDAKILDRRILGSYNSVVPFVYYIYLQKNQKLVGESVRRDLKNALYLSLMTSVFSRWGDSRIDAVIREVFYEPNDRLLGTFPLTDFRSFVQRREGRDRIDNWLLQQNIALLLNILEGGTVLPVGQRSKRPEVDHIFPRSKLAQAGYSSDEINDFANFRLVASLDNNWKSNTDPQPYFDANPGVAEQYLIPIDLLEYEKYREFLLVRRNRIWNRIKEFLGLTEDEMPANRPITPGQENGAIDRFESDLRTFIDTILKESQGEDYWKLVIPAQTQRNVKERINQYLKHHPDKSWYDFTSGESRLTFCDMSDYELIILAKNNWPYFGPIVRSQDEFSRYIKSIIRFRNSVKHGRDIDLVERLMGEAGLIWFHRILEPQMSDSDDEVLPDGQLIEEDFKRLLTRIPVPYGQQQLYRALYFAEGNMLMLDELTDVVGNGNGNRFGGIMGALGVRVNGTPGYGQEQKPGTKMIGKYEKLDGNRWRFTMHSKLNEVLKELNPDWLKPLS